MLRSTNASVLASYTVPYRARSPPRRGRGRSDQRSQVHNSSCNGSNRPFSGGVKGTGRIGGVFGPVFLARSRKGYPGKVSLLYHFSGWSLQSCFGGCVKPASLLGFYGESAGARTQDQRLKRALPGVRGRACLCGNMRTEPAYSLDFTFFT
jgi:hypothetical protein